MRHLHKDPRFGKVYGVSRRDLYDVPTEHIEHVKLDLLNPQKVKEELSSKGVNDGKTLTMHHSAFPPYAGSVSAHVMLLT